MAIKKINFRLKLMLAREREKSSPNERAVKHASRQAGKPKSKVGKRKMLIRKERNIIIIL